MSDKVTLSNDELIARCDKWIEDLCKDRTNWTLSVPVQFNRDPDTLFTELIRRFKQAASQPPAEKADDILDDVHQRIIDGQLKGMSLEKAIYTVGYEDGRKEKGAVWVKAQIIALQTHLDSLSKRTEDAFEKNVIGHRIGDLYTALQVIDKYADFFETESPTAAGDGKEAIKSADARIHELEIVLYWLLKSAKPLAKTALEKKRVENAEYTLNKGFDPNNALRSQSVASVEFTEWALQNTDGINHEKKWYYDNLWLTSAQLYDIFKQQNK